MRDWLSVLVVGEKNGDGTTTSAAGGGALCSVVSGLVAECTNTALL